MMRDNGAVKSLFGTRIFTPLLAELALNTGRRLQLEALEDRRLLDASPYLVKDINAVEIGSNPNVFVEMGGLAFFTANDTTSGIELWKTDGTAAGTALVKDIRPGSSSSNPTGLINVNGTLFFAADDGTNGGELWKSDGTAAGTVLIKDIRTGAPGANLGNFTLIDGTLFFSANDGVNGFELWKTNGTAAGTVLVKDILAGSSNSYPDGLTNVSGTLFLSANDGSGTALWKSDGTAGGTVLVKAIAPGTPADLTNVNGTLFFSADGGTGAELWTSDGTSTGTLLVKDIRVGSAGSLRYQGARVNLTNLNGTAFFIADDGITGRELWKSDGTAAGTLLVKDIQSGSGGSVPANLTNVNGTLFFSANDGAIGQELWKSDGTAAGTLLVKDIQPGSGGSGYLTPTNVNGTLFFAANDGTSGRELWKSDGTAAGTVLVRDISPGIFSSISAAVANINGTLLFAANDAVNGRELWKSDGTAAGTVLVKNIATGTTPGSMNNVTLVSFDGSVFFPANDGLRGFELWKSDGSAAGTVLVKDTIPGAETAEPNFLTNVNGTLFFGLPDSPYRSLWKSDGTETGTVFLKDVVAGAASNAPLTDVLVNLNGTLLFRAYYNEGYELWRSDGTAAGTLLVKDINPDTSGGYPHSSNPRYLTNMNGTLFFSADDGTNGRELWKSDGTTAGTVLVKNIRGPGNVGGGPSSSPEYFTNVNGTLFFSANDGVNGGELWKSDGTAAGTVLVKDIRAGSSSSYPGRSGGGMVNVNGTLYFMANDGTSGVELWKSDGTAAGTVRVKDIQPGSGGSVPANLTNVNGTLFFTADDGSNGRELWSSDGTSGGTVLVKDIQGGLAGSSTFINTANEAGRILANVGGTLYFAADDGTHGQELWQSDGTTAGTVLVMDIFPGISSASPFNFTDIGGKLYFTANDGVHGTELWSLYTSGPPTLDLNGAAVGTSHAGMWTNSGPAPLADPTQATLFNPAGPNLTQLTATLVSPNAGDLLAANTSGTSIVASFNGTVLTLSGTDTSAHYQQVLRTIAYNNTLGGPPVSSLTVQLVASASALSSPPATATLAIDLAPTVQSIARYNPASPNTNATMVQFLATFSEPVEEVDTEDFAIALTGSVSGTIFDAVLWTDTAYLVTVNGISGSGTLGLNFVPNGSILDSIGNTVLNGFVGQTYTIGSPSSTIAGRHIFYNQSVWDGNSALIQAANDNAARATDKSAYLPGAGLAVAANITSFTRGITGIMVDLSAGGNHAALTASDFLFKVGNNNTPSLWAAAPAPTAVSVIAGGGVGGSDRVEITWASGAIRNQWLEVQVKANANTGLSTTDVHFWGNKIADSGTTAGAGTFDTTSTDAAQVFATIGAGKPITDLRDYNRDGQVTSTDAALVFANIGNIVRINVGAGGPFAPDVEPLMADDGTNSAMASALVTTSDNASVRNAPPKVALRLREAVLHIRRVDECFRQMISGDTPRTSKSGKPSVSNDDAQVLDAELLDALITTG